MDETSTTNALSREFEAAMNLGDHQAQPYGLRKQRSQRLTVPIHNNNSNLMADYGSGDMLQRRDTTYSDDSSNPSFPGSPYPGGSSHPYASLSPPPPLPPVTSAAAGPFHAYHHHPHHHLPPQIPPSHSPPNTRLNDPFSHANGYRVADWTRPGGPPPPSSAGYMMPPSSQMPQHHSSSSQSSMLPLQPSAQPKMAPMPQRTMMHGQDEVITNAIVIKNIPFAVPKEALLAVMEDLRLPLPFAFNYHYDNGQFRGLAFANFRQDSDAALTVTALNGFDLQGRKLRTEFKRVLKEGEKEKIEREKAIKRMTSQQQMYQNPQDAWARPPPMPQYRPQQQQQPQQDEDDYGRLLNDGPFSMNGQHSRPFINTDLGGAGGAGGNSHSNATTSSATGYSPFSAGPSYSTSPPSDVGTSISTRMTATSSASSDYSNSELDLNDPQALEIYSRVLLFKDDSLRDELAFSRSLTPGQRRTVHLVAQKLNLSHKSVGEGEERHVIVFKAVPPVSLGLPEASKPLRHAQSTLGRHTSRDVVSYLFPDEPVIGSSGTGTSTTRSTSPSGSVDYYSGGGGGRLTNSPLRTKKSMPDIRPSSNSSSSSLTAPTSSSHNQHFHHQSNQSGSSSGAWGSSNFYYSGSNLQSRRSGGNLREHYHSSSSSSSPTKKNSGYPSMKGLFGHAPSPTPASGDNAGAGVNAEDGADPANGIPPVPKIPLALQSQVSAPIGTPASVPSPTTQNNPSTTTNATTPQ